MAFNRDENQAGKGGSPFDIGEDFKQFLQNQPQTNPNQPNAPVPDPVKAGAGAPEAPPDGGVAGEGNSETPRERGGAGAATAGANANPDVPRILTPPSPEGKMGGPSPTLPQGQAPNPAAAGPATTFTPMKGPGPEDMVKPSQFAPLGAGSLLGSAGGLLGGGLGTPGESTDPGASDNLLPLLLQLLGQ